MRVLSRRRKFAKAVACGYSEGAGFTVSNRTLPFSLAGRSAPHLGDPSTRRWRAVSQATRVCALGCASGITLTRCQSGPHQQEAERAATWGRWPLLDGVGELCPWRRGRVSRAAGSAQLGPFTSPHPPAAERQTRGDGVECRPKTPPDGVGERSPARVTALCRLVVSATEGQRQNGTAVAHARRHKHCSTAAARTAHVVHRSLHCTHHR